MTQKKKRSLHDLGVLASDKIRRSKFVTLLEALFLVVFIKNLTRPMITTSILSEI